MIWIGKRKLTVCLTFILLFFLVVIVNHYLSANLTKSGEYFDDGEAAASTFRVTSQEKIANKDIWKITTVTDESTPKKVGFVKFGGVVDFPTTSTADPLKLQHRQFELEKQRSGQRAFLTSDGTRFIPKHRVVHLDMKGAPPKMTYLKNIFPLLKEAGATALLIEYEDMFPFWGSLRNVSAKNCYSANDVQTIQMWAAQNDLMVIPLIQTFGHLEFVLKLNEFKNLREIPIYPQSICPSQEASWDLITQMIDQVVSLHPDSEWIHIGCDEVYQLGQCSKCSERIVNANRDPETTTYHDGKTLYLEHVHRIATYVREKKKLIPIIWDDMLRSIPSQTLQSSGIGSLVEPMIWVYIEDIDRFIDSVTWTTYGSVFEHLWTASAFKGAFGERLYSVNIQRHVINHLSWLEVMRRESSSVKHLKFRGVVLTGWSRYDHFAVLCELLPAAFPSLVLNLAILSRGGQDFEAIHRAHRILQCGTQKALMTPEELRRNPVQWDLHRCHFPGSSLVGLLSTYNMNRKEVELAYERINIREGWMTQYNVDHRFSSPYRVHEMMRPISYLSSSLRSLEGQLQKVLANYFDKYTVQEWIEQHMSPLMKVVDDINSRAIVLTSVVSWPQRPLDFSQETKTKNEAEEKTSTDSNIAK